MFRIAVEMDSTSNRPADRMIAYTKSYIDLAEIAMVIDNSGGGTVWKVCLKSGKEINVAPYNGQSLSFDGFLKHIKKAKLLSEQGINYNEDESDED
jgi:hypothetical protein